MNPGGPGPDGTLHLPPGVEAAALLHTLFEANSDGLLLVDGDGGIVGGNPAAAQMLGYTVDELRTLHVEQLVPLELRDRHAGYRAGYARTPRARPMGTQLEIQARRKDGSLLIVEISLSPLECDGRLCVVAALRDISAFPRVKQAVLRARYAEQLARLGRLAADSRDPQVLLPEAPAIAAETLHAETSIVYLLQPNRREWRVAAAVGAPAGATPGTTFSAAADSPLGRVLGAAAPLRVDDVRTDTRVSVPASWLGAGMRSGLGVPLSDRGRAVGVLVVASTSVRHFGDDELHFAESIANLLATSLQRAQSEEALNHAQRLESVGQLTGGIAHDFNNLLTVIHGNLQVLEELPAVADDAYAQQLVAAAARASRRGAELTGKLLAFSRRQVLQPTPVDVGALLGSLADMLRRTLDQRIRIEVETAPGCPAVLADPGQLENALLNIAINARDAMADGGLLCFRAEPCAALPAELRHDFEEQGRPAVAFVAIAIRDTGSGMADEVRERAFEPFFTTKGAGRGTGLGLSTVYGFVRQSHGAVAIDSAEGIGTTLTLYLPQPGAAGTAAAEPAEAAAPVPVGLRVLLVEDDADVRDVMQRFLDGLGCRTVATANAEQALLALGGDAPFDLLLTDIALGAGMRGTRLAERARERQPGLAVLMMSGYSSELIAADRDVPADWELLRKPCTRADLAAAIGRVMAPRNGRGAP